MLLHHKKIVDRLVKKRGFKRCHVIAAFKILPQLPLQDLHMCCINLTRYCQGKKWSRSTASKMQSILRVILLELKPNHHIDKKFTSRLRINRRLWETKKIESGKIKEPEKNLRIVFGKKFSNPSHPLHRNLLKCFQYLNEETCIASPLTAKNILTYFRQVLFPYFFKKWSPPSTRQSFESLNTDEIRKLTSNFRSNKLRWLQHFGNIFFSPQNCLLEREDVKKAKLDTEKRLRRLRRNFDRGNNNNNITTGSGSKHRLTVEELEKIHAATTQNPKEELLFLLMISTGLRAGGVVRIRMMDIFQNSDCRFPKNFGETIEKGNKKVRFALIERVRQILPVYAQYHRPEDEKSIYLFPGCSGSEYPTSHISPGSVYSLFRKWTVSAGLPLSDPKFHPHALRHTFALTLLGLGNTPEDVAKLMNHTSTACTQKYYLKESIQEVIGRTQIPWYHHLNGVQKKEKNFLHTLPSFLRPSPAIPAKPSLLQKLETFLFKTHKNESYKKSKNTNFRYRSP